MLFANDCQQLRSSRLLPAAAACVLASVTLAAAATDDQTGAVAHLPKMRELSSSCLYLLSWLFSVNVDSICFRMSLVDCTFFWLLLAKLTDVTLPPVILAAAAVLAAQ